MITNFKLRASYGVTGNQEIGNYQSLALLSKNNYIYDNNILNTTKLLKIDDMCNFLFMFINLN